MLSIDLNQGGAPGAKLGRRDACDLDVSGRFADWHIAADRGGGEIQAGPLTTLDQFSVTGIFPVGLGFDPREGEIFVYGGFQANVNRYDTAGAPLGSFANPGAASDDYDLDYVSEPFVMNGVDVPVGSVLVIDGNNPPAEIYAVDPSDGAVIAMLNTTFGGVVGGAYHAERGAFFLIDDGTDTVAEIDPATGAILNSFLVAFDVFYGDMDVDPVSGDLFLVSSREPAIHRVTAEGAFVEELALPAGIRPPSGIALNDIKAGDGYVSDNNNNGAIYHLSGFATITAQTGTGAADTIDGGGGADSLAGLAGDDVLDGMASLDTLEGGGGNDSLVGGTGVDVMLGGDDDDTLNGGAGADTLNGGGGIDWADYSNAAAKVLADLQAPNLNTGDAAGDVYVEIENLRGGGFNDALRGDAGANILDGGGKNDNLSSRKGDDTLIGGDGKDTLNGGAGADQLVLASVDPDEVDKIAAFDADDVIALDSDVYGLPEGALAAGRFVVGNAAQDADDRIIYRADQGKLYFDPDGTGAAAQLLIANFFAPAPTLSAADFTVI